MFPFIQSFYGMQQSQQQQRRQTHYSDCLQVLNSYSVERYNMEVGNKILLPSSALQQLINNRQNGPMIFKLQNMQNQKILYVGVLEFIAEEGSCVVPNWIFESMGLFEGCQVMISLAPQLPKGKLIKLQPHETAFIDLPDPRAVLENQLRNHVCLTEGNTITVTFSGKQYNIDIVSVTPVSDFKAVDINEADVEIDFAPPLDYEEAPPNLIKKTSQLSIDEQPQQKNGISVFQGKAVRIDGKTEKPNDRKQSSDIQQQQVQEPYNPRKHKLVHGVKKEQAQVFQGQGVKLSNTKPPIK